MTEFELTIDEYQLFQRAVVALEEISQTLAYMKENGIRVHTPK